MPFTSAQKEAVRSAVAEYAAIINVKFVETLSPDPDINLGRVNISGGESGEGGYQYTYATDGNGAVTHRTLDGFAVFDNQLAAIPRNTIFRAREAKPQGGARSAATARPAGPSWLCSASAP